MSLCQSINMNFACGEHKNRNNWNHKLLFNYEVKVRAFVESDDRVTRTVIKFSTIRKNMKLHYIWAIIVSSNTEYMVNDLIEKPTGQ